MKSWLNVSPLGVTLKVGERGLRITSKDGSKAKKGLDDFVKFRDESPTHFTEKEIGNDHTSDEMRNGITEDLQEISVVDMQAKDQIGHGGEQEDDPGVGEEPEESAAEVSKPLMEASNPVRERDFLAGRSGSFPGPIGSAG